MSSRALDTSWYHYLRINPAVLTSQGYRWDYESINSLGSGGQDTIGFLTGSRPVSFIRISIETTGSRGASFEMYFGGTTALGAPLTGYPANHESFKPEPLVSIEDSSIVQTPGVQIASGALHGGIGGSVGPGLSAVMILRADSFYYINVINDDNQTATLEVSMSFAAIGGDIEA